MPVELTLEQKLALRLKLEEFDRTETGEIKRSLVELYATMMMQDNLYKAQLRQAWGLEDAPIVPVPPIQDHLL